MIPLCIIEAFHFNGIKLKGNKTILLSQLLFSRKVIRTSYVDVTDLIRNT